MEGIQKGEFQPNQNQPVVDQTNIAAGFKICVIGATGAIGREIVRTALADDRVG